MGIWHHPVPIQSATTDVNTGVTGIYLLRHVSSVIHELSVLLRCFIQQLKEQHEDSLMKTKCFGVWRWKHSPCSPFVVHAARLWRLFSSSGWVPPLNVSWWRTLSSVTDWLNCSQHVAWAQSCRDDQQEQTEARSSSSQQLELRTTGAWFQKQKCQVDSRGQTPTQLVLQRTTSSWNGAASCQFKKDTLGQRTKMTPLNYGSDLLSWFPTQ